MKKHTILLGATIVLVVAALCAVIFIAPFAKDASIQDGTYRAHSDVYKTVHFDAEAQTFSVLDPGYMSDLPTGTYYCKDGKLYAEVTSSRVFVF